LAGVLVASPSYGPSNRLRLIASAHAARGPG